jgi:hypothetical protein
MKTAPRGGDKIIVVVFLAVITAALLGRVDIHGIQQRSAASWTNARKLRLVLS